MQEEIKLLCNHCYQLLEVVTYPEGVYVNACDCIEERIQEEVDKATKGLYDEAWQEGNDEGYSLGREEGYNDGLQDGKQEGENEVEEFREKFKKYAHIIEEEEYRDRLGAE